ncbi:MAG TPA: HD domain-containing protein [Rhodanobacteraceae bacterium]|nr:HD domain-containing protein [Rhodanobacteraceae bacterium]
MTRWRDYAQFVILRGILVRVTHQSRKVSVFRRYGSGAQHYRSGHLRLARPLHGRDWIVTWWWAARVQLPANVRQSVDALDPGDLIDRLFTCAHRSGTLPEARRKILQTVLPTLDAGLLKRAKRLSATASAEFSTRQYELCYTHDGALRQRIADSPRLLPLYDLLDCDAKSQLTPLDDLSVVKRHLRSRGLGEAGWKLLCRFGRELWQPLDHCHEFGRDYLDMVIDHANLVASCQRRRLPPPALCTAVGNIRSMATNANSFGPMFRPLFHAAWRHCESLPDRQSVRRFARDELPEVMAEWFRGERPPDVPRHVRWSWFVRKLLPDASDRHREVSADWCAINEPRRIGACDVLPVTSLGSAREAGRRLRNCLVNAHDSSYTNGLPLFLIKEGETIRAAFSACATPDGWSMSEIRGPENSPVDRGYAGLARRYLRELGLAPMRASATVTKGALPLPSVQPSHKEMNSVNSAPAPIARILHAASFAAEKHRDQRRKGVEASPYINHPLKLADVLANEGGVTDIEILCAALLHDTIEDTKTTEAELREQFGDSVANIVREVTDNKNIDKEVRKQLQIGHAPNLSPQAKLVKLADKICNLRDLLTSPPADWSAERKRAYFEWAQQVIAGVRGTHASLEATFDEICRRAAASA